MESSSSENQDRNMTVVIDPGHGGDDNGAAWGEKYDYLEEDDTNLSVAFLLRCELEKAGIEVHLTRVRDEAMRLRDRTRFANRIVPDLFVSIHCDAFHNTTAHGMGVHIYPACGRNTRDAAARIRRSLAETFPEHKQRGIKESNFYVLRKTVSPAVLIECEFVSNPETRRFLKEPENQLALAKAIARAII